MAPGVAGVGMEAGMDGRIKKAMGSAARATEGVKVRCGHEFLSLDTTNPLV